MKRLLWLIVSLLWLQSFLMACSGARPINTTPVISSTLPAATIGIATDATFPPFETYDMNTKALAGFDIELMNAIAAKTGMKIVFIHTGLNQLLSGVAQCKVDAGISAISISDELGQHINFSDPYMTTGQVVVVKKGNLTIADRTGLAGKLVGAAVGTPASVEVTKIDQAQLKTYPSLDLAFQDLITGYIDAVIVDLPHAQSYVNIKANNLKIVGDPFAEVVYGIAICKQRGDLLQKINTGLAAVKADGSLDRLKKKWIVQPLAPEK